MAQLLWRSIDTWWCWAWRQPPPRFSWPHLLMRHLFSRADDFSQGIIDIASLAPKFNLFTTERAWYCHGEAHTQNDVSVLFIRSREYIFQVINSIGMTLKYDIFVFKFDISVADITDEEILNEICSDIAGHDAIDRRDILSHTWSEARQHIKSSRHRK